MIYYYFGDKEGLYLSALENAYRQVREGESKLDIEGLPPLEALRRLVEFTFDHHHQHEDFIRMVMIENIHHGEYLDRSEGHPQSQRHGDRHIKAIYARGVDRRASSAQTSTRSSCTGRSARSASSTSPTAPPSRRSSAAISARPRRWPSLRRNAVDMVLRYVVRADKLPKD